MERAFGGHLRCAGRGEGHDDTPIHQRQLDVDSTLYVNAEDFFFFINQLRVIGDPMASPVSDFLVGERTFEVGGRNKKQRQIRGVGNDFVVKDDIEYGGLNVVPLWQFGMLY